MYVCVCERESHRDGSLSEALVRVLPKPHTLQGYLAHKKPPTHLGQP